MLDARQYAAMNVENHLPSLDITLKECKSPPVTDLELAVDIHQGKILTEAERQKALKVPGMAGLNSSRAKKPHKLSVHEQDPNEYQLDIAGSRMTPAKPPPHLLPAPVP